jgi:hypothetical protein
MQRPRAAAARRTRGSWTPRIAGISAAVVIACGGAIIYAVASPAGTGRTTAALSGRVQSVQTVGIIGQAGGAVGEASMLRMLAVPAGRHGLVFAPIPAADLPQGDPQWTVDTMGDGTYIFIYAPSGACLAATGDPGRAAVALRRCDLGPLQRWRPVNGSVQLGGNEYSQYRNLGTGRCLATGGTPAPGPPALRACRPASPVRQLISFYWGVLSGSD